MLRFFRSYHIMVFVTILSIGVVSWLHVLRGTENYLSGKYATFMFHLLSGWFADHQKLYVWSGLILFLLIALLMTLVNTRLHLTDKNSMLPALCYVLLIGGVPEIHRFNPSIIATVFLVTGFILLAKSFESERLSYIFFTVPVIFSIATFFHRYMYVYMLVVWIVIALLRPGYWREWVFSFLGFVVLLFFAFSWFFLVEDDYTRTGIFIDEIFSLQRATPELSTPSILFVSSCTLLTFSTFGHMLRYMRSNKVILRKRYFLLILMFFVSAGMVFFIPDLLPSVWYLLAFPMSFILSGYLATTRSLRWGTIVLLLLFAGVTVVQTILLSTR